MEVKKIYVEMESGTEYPKGGVHVDLQRQVITDQSGKTLAPIDVDLERQIACFVGELEAVLLYQVEVEGKKKRSRKVIKGGK